MTEDIQFVCGTCGNDYEGETDNVLTRCRVCQRLNYSDCVDEHGRCIECADD